MTTVSVIIPCYNSGAFIDEAVRSALDQTHRDLEIVVIDDGSKDAQTLEVLRNNSWKRTRILRQENMGPAAARNAGIRAAVGKFILPLDADDRIAPTYVEKALAVLRTQPDVGIVYCKAMCFGDYEGPWDIPPYSEQEMVINNCIFCTALFRKSDWEAVGGYRENMRSGLEDYDFWIKMISKGIGVYQIDEYLFYYRIQKISRTTNFCSDNERIIATSAEIFRNNIEFFAQHADVIYRHINDLSSEIRTLRGPLNKIDNLLRQVPTLRKFAKSIYKKVVK